ncbi:MAG: DUF131 domain-containing protein [Candidatus Thorarchaeota archaeon]
MQITLTQSIGWFLLIGGILLIFLAIILTIRQDHDGPGQMKTESKGIIFLGPIPIMWGYGRGSRIISAIGLIAILLYIVFFIL